MIDEVKAVPASYRRVLKLLEHAMGTPIAEEAHTALGRVKVVCGEDGFRGWLKVAVRRVVVVKHAQPVIKSHVAQLAADNLAKRTIAQLQKQVAKSAEVVRKLRMAETDHDAIVARLNTEISYWQDQCRSSADALSTDMLRPQVGFHFYSHFRQQVISRLDGRVVGWVPRFAKASGIPMAEISVWQDTRMVPDHVVEQVPLLDYPPLTAQDQCDADLANGVAYRKVCEALQEANKALADLGDYTVQPTGWYQDHTGDPAYVTYELFEATLRRVAGLHEAPWMAAYAATAGISFRMVQQWLHDQFVPRRYFDALLTLDFRPVAGVFEWDEERDKELCALSEQRGPDRVFVLDIAKTLSRKYDQAVSAYRVRKRLHKLRGREQMAQRAEREIAEAAEAAARATAPERDIILL